MGLQAILNAIQVTFEEQVRQIEAGAEKTAEEILSVARDKAPLVQADFRASATACAGGQCARILHQARLDALQVVDTAREALVDEALRQARERLADIRIDSTYSSALRNLTSEAVAGLEETASLAADPRDRDLLQKILLEMGDALPVDYECECYGGVIARSRDGRVVAINTLDSRLASATPYLRQRLAGLFEQAAWRSERCQAEHGGAIFPQDSRIPIAVSSLSASEDAPQAA